MNEEQRKASGQVSSSDKKSEKDYSQYFEAVYIPPSLKEAKNGVKKKSNTINFKLTSGFKVQGTAASFIFAHMAVK